MKNSNKRKLSVVIVLIVGIMTVVIYSIRKNSNIQNYSRDNSKQSEEKAIRIYMKESKNYFEILGIISGIIISILSLLYAISATTIANKDVEINEATNLPVFNLSILDNREIFTDLSIINTVGIVSNVQIEIESYLTIRLNYHTYNFLYTDNPNCYYDAYNNQFNFTIRNEKYVDQLYNEINLLGITKIDKEAINIENRIKITYIDFLNRSYQKAYIIENSDYSLQTFDSNKYINSDVSHYQKLEYQQLEPDILAYAICSVFNAKTDYNKVLYSPNVPLYTLEPSEKNGKWRFALSDNNFPGISVGNDKDGVVTENSITYVIDDDYKSFTGIAYFKLNSTDTYARDRKFVLYMYNGDELTFKHEFFLDDHWLYFNIDVTEYKTLRIHVLARGVGEIILYNTGFTLEQ